MGDQLPYLSIVVLEPNAMRFYFFPLAFSPLLLFLALLLLSLSFPVLEVPFFAVNTEASLVVWPSGISIKSISWLLLRKALSQMK